MIYEVKTEGGELVTFHNNQRISAFSFSDILEKLSDYIAFETIMDATDKPEDLHVMFWGKDYGDILLEFIEQKI